MMADEHSTAETVLIPAALLRDLVWAAEALSNAEPDEDDRRMIQAGRRALEEQAPLTTMAMLEADLIVDTAQSDGDGDG